MRELSRTNLSRRAFLLRSEMLQPCVAITDQCFAARGIYCESCRDACESGALRFVPQLGSVSRLIVEPDRCTQCGECVQVCPQNAIRVQPIKVTHA